MESSIIKNFERTSVFYGLKLNTMKRIKEEVAKLDVIVKNTVFCIRFSVRNGYVDSIPFKIVSSFRQLPKEEQMRREEN